MDTILRLALVLLPALPHPTAGDIMLVAMLVLTAIAVSRAGGDWRR